MSDKLELWNKVADIDLHFTKKVQVGNQQPFTNIDGYELLRMATEEFGTYGKGFGICKMDWSEKEVGDTTLLILDALFYYPGGEFPYRNTLKYIYKTKGGYMAIDEDAPKKLTTNTIGKCLSHLGFGASVYMGMFEDQNYIDEMLGSMETLVQPYEVQKLLKGINYYKVSKEDVLKQYHITHLSKLPQNKLQECEAFIKKIGEEVENADID